MLWLKFDDPPRRDQEIGRREDQQEQWRCDRQASTPRSDSRHISKRPGRNSSGSTGWADDHGRPVPVQRRFGKPVGVHPPTARVHGQEPGNVAVAPATGVPPGPRPRPSGTTDRESVPGRGIRASGRRGARSKWLERRQGVFGEPRPLRRAAPPIGQRGPRPALPGSRRIAHPTHCCACSLSFWSSSCLDIELAPVSSTFSAI
jgi:hypothetical protein